MRPLLVFLLRLATLYSALLGCSRAIFVKAEGRYDEAVYFRLYDPTRTTLITHNIVQVLVQEQNAEHGWDIVWALEGERSTAEVQYGRTYEGLKETVRAKPLSLNKTYRVHVTDRPRFDPIGYGDVAFTFQENGEIVMM